jgi:hypothetical protein
LLFFNATPGRVKKRRTSLGAALRVCGLSTLLAFHIKAKPEQLRRRFAFAGDRAQSTSIQKTRRAACMDARRFPSRQDAESENPLERLGRELLPPRGKAAFFGYFLCGGKESDPLAQ